MTDVEIAAQLPADVWRYFRNLALSRKCQLTEYPHTAPGLQCCARARAHPGTCFQTYGMQASELELTSLRTENASLREELRRAQNAAAETRNARFLSSPGPGGSGGAVRRVLEAEAAAAEAQRGLAAARIASDEAARCDSQRCRLSCKSISQTVFWVSCCVQGMYLLRIAIVNGSVARWVTLRPGQGRLLYQHV